MSFQAFAEQHGLIIDHLVYDKWTRVKTTDHPNKKNGSYIFNGDSGAVLNWAVHEKAILWRGAARNDPLYRVKIQQSQKNTEERNQKAAYKAGWILKQATKATHAYLSRKGFAEEEALVWEGNLVIPMRIEGAVSGLQLIDIDGSKKFLSGQKNKGAVAIFDNKGIPLLCEGYATAMSIRRALKAIKTRYKIIVCFSASNLLEVSKQFPDGLIVADHDPVGIKTAKKTNRPYWVSPNTGEDFNDFELRVGAATAGKSLIALLS